MFFIKPHSLRFALIAALALALVVGALLLGPTAQAEPASSSVLSPPPNANGVPRPDRVLVVVEENHAYSQIIGSSAAPYINGLAQQGALFTNSYGITHPSQPNYLNLFSGSNQGVTGNTCPNTFSTANLGSALIAAGLTFVGYSEDLPAPGSTVCTSGAYARKHSPWINFTNVPTSSNLPFTSYPSDYSQLPTFSYVIPNLNHDMHDGTIQQGDTWLQQYIGAYIQWTMTHNSLFILTWDEDDNSESNHIPTIFIGPMVATGQYSENVNHYNMLRTMEDMYDLPYAGVSGNYQPITDVWITGTVTITPTPLPTNTRTITPTRTQSNTATVTLTRTPSSTPTLTPTNAPSGTTIATATFTDTPQPSGTIIATVTPTATDTGVLTPSATPTGSPSATATSTPCTMSFSDVQPSDYFYDAVRYLYCHSAVSGYADGTFRPYNNTTRGQLCKIIVLAMGWDIDPSNGPHFSDVPPTHPFYEFVETAYNNSIIAGYGDGTFRPTNNVTRGQLCKIIVLAVGWGVECPATGHFTDVPAGSTFYCYVETAYGRGVVSGYGDGTFRPGNNATRGQICKIVYSAVTLP